MGSLHLGDVDPRDVEKITRGNGDGWTVILVHNPTLTRVEITDATTLLAESKAWLKLRDKLEGYS